MIELDNLHIVRYLGIIILTLNLEVITVQIIIKSSTLNTVFEKFKTELTKSLFYQHFYIYYMRSRYILLYDTLRKQQFDM